jgi:hypothetical protein
MSGASAVSRLFFAKHWPRAAQMGTPHAAPSGCTINGVAAAIYP